MAPWTNPPASPRQQIARRLAAAFLLLTSVFVALSSPAAAQESEDAQQPEPAEGEPAAAPAEAVETPGDAGDTPAAAETGEEPAPIDPLDPLSNEAPGEEAPATDITVPPKDTYEGQEAYEPPAILWSSVAAADQKLDETSTAKRAAISEVRRLRMRLKELGADQETLDEETVETLDTLIEATNRLRERAVVGYQWFGSGSTPATEAVIADYADVVETQRRSKLVDTALLVGEADMDELDLLRESLNGEAVALLDRMRIVSDHLADAENEVAGFAAEAEQAEIEYEAFKAGSEIFIHGVVFPIAGDYSRPLVDSYGFPRMPGTPDEHWHEGIDLFAARGTPLVATERGVITKLGSGRLGGLKFWLKGESGSEWYYAHLDSFAPGLADGVVVEAGQLVGYVGNTGNAISTPPHLHMQLHPDGGRPVNPYPLLKVVSDLDQAAIAAGTHPGYEHESYASGPVEVAQPDQPQEPEPNADADVGTDPQPTDIAADPAAATTPVDAAAPDPAPEEAPVDPPVPTEESVDGESPTATDVADPSDPADTPDSSEPDGPESDGPESDGPESDGPESDGTAGADGAAASG